MRFKTASTVIIPPKLAHQHVAQLHRFKVNDLDVPVSGGTIGAEQAMLSIMAGAASQVQLKDLHTILATTEQDNGGRTLNDKPTHSPYTKH